MDVVRVATIAFGFVVASTGVGLLIASAETTPGLVLQVLHVGVGLWMIAPAVGLVTGHARRMGASPVGAAATAVVVTCVSTGVLKALAAVLGQGAPSWILPLHGWTAAVGGVMLVGHAVPALLASRRARSRLPVARVVQVLVGLVLVVSVAGFWGRRSPSVPSDYELPYGSELFAPSALRTASGGLLEPHQLAGSAACRTCHQEIFRQWSESMHRYAATDPHVVVGMRWFQRENGVAAGRFCAGCHDPVSLTSGAFDRSVTSDEVGVLGHEEGISCMGCHAIDALVEQPGVTFGNGSYRLAPLDRPTVQGWLYDVSILMDAKAHGERLIPDRPKHKDRRNC